MDDSHSHTAATLPASSSSLVFLGSHVLGSTNATMTVSSIPATYKDLIIVIRARTTDPGAGCGLTMQVGAGSVDTGSNYGYFHWFTGWTSSTGSSTGATSAAIGVIPNSGATAGFFSAGRLELLDYASTAHAKPWVGQNFYQDGSGVLISSYGGQWKTTSSAIDIVTVTPGAGSFASGSALYVYGRV